jgi:hypothetical protein
LSKENSIEAIKENKESIGVDFQDGIQRSIWNGG